MQSTLDHEFENYLCTFSLCLYRYEMCDILCVLGLVSLATILQAEVTKTHIVLSLY